MTFSSRIWLLGRRPLKRRLPHLSGFSFEATASLKPRGMNEINDELMQSVRGNALQIHLFIDRSEELNSY